MVEVLALGLVHDRVVHCVALELVVLSTRAIAHVPSLDLGVGRELVVVPEKFLKCVVRQLTLEGLLVLLLALLLDVAALIFGSTLSFWCILPRISSCILARRQLILTYLDRMTTVVTIQRNQRVLVLALEVMSIERRSEPSAVRRRPEV